MGSSNGPWGEADSPEAQQWHDEWAAMWPPGLAGSVALDEWLARRRLDAWDLEAVGFRWHEGELVFYHPQGLKYRNLSGGRRTTDGAEFTQLKIVRHRTPGDAAGLIVAEGETDGAVLFKQSPMYDVGILPAGAKPPTADMLAQCKHYEHVLVATDADEAGDKAARAWHQALPQSMRLRPPEPFNDWGEAWAADRPWKEDDLTSPPKVVYSIREVMQADLGTKAESTWIEDGMLPVGGLMALHATKKSGKSFILLDLARSLATGLPFAQSYVRLGPKPHARVLLYQLEVPPFYFQARMQALIDTTDEWLRDQLLDNVFVYEVGNNRLPRLRIGDGWTESVAACAEYVEADVIMFDPIQKMVGAASLNQTDEMAGLLDGFADLQAAGFTVVYSHHNKKDERNSHDGAAMAGTQRFAADPDAIGSVYRSPTMIADDNSKRIKERNISWELRNGAARPCGLTIMPDEVNPTIPKVIFGEPHAALDTGEELF